MTITHLYPLTYRNKEGSQTHTVVPHMSSMSRVSAVSQENDWYNMMGGDDITYMLAVETLNKTISLFTVYSSIHHLCLESWLKRLPLHYRVD